jgi:Bifunctional DNA primase/polymerase, N-terminal/AAA domain
MPFKDLALDLINRGFSVIPLQPRGKSPIGPGATSRTNERAVIDVWVSKWPEANVGICADENVTILESDDAARLRGILAEQGVALPVTLTGGASENRPHWFYKRTPACGESCVTVPGLFEFRNKNQYVVGPGSVHPSGALYRWWNDSPMVELPDATISALRELADNYAGQGTAKGEHIQPGPYSRLRHAYMRHLDPADLLTLDLEISEGERHYTLMSLAGLLHDGERSAEDIAEILKSVQDQYFDGTKSDTEIESIAYYATRGEPCNFEPFELESHSVGTYVFTDAAAKEQWIAANLNNFSVSWDFFATQELPEQKVLLTLNGVPILREEMLAEVFAFRGIGKSALVAALIKSLVKGKAGDFLGFHSDGGNRVLLVDGELPERLLQQRLASFVGSGTGDFLRVRSLAQTKDGYLPPLADPKQQEEFIANLSAWRPQVIILDTKTALFKHDTNEQAALLAVNEFLIQLRSKGFTVITTHHAGKNGTQRGRTDNDDITDLIIQLKARSDWAPGMGLEFSLEFEKVRYGDKLEGFEAKWEAGVWSRVEATQEKQIIDLLMAGKGINSIAKTLGVGNSTIARVKRKALENGVEFPKGKSK